MVEPGIKRRGRIGKAAILHTPLREKSVMIFRTTFAATIVAAGLGLTVPSAGAAEVHKWMDKEGTVHYSASPPVQCLEDAAAETAGDLQCEEIKTLEFPNKYQEPEQPDADYYSVINQAQRLEAARLAREEEREEREAEERRERESALLAETLLRNDYRDDYYGSRSVYPFLPPAYYKPYAWPHQRPYWLVPHHKAYPHQFRHPRSEYRHPGILNNPPPRPGFGFQYRGGGEALDLDRLR